MAISEGFPLLSPGRAVLAARRGDYVAWGRGVDHSWRAEEEPAALTVRWPSVAGYAVVRGETASTLEN
ncbi:hypothetical protein [Nonomuraea sp. NPDC048916]|uniref:hypothetical protein n=1 Tax=Nonomuraea sp. NPDC048916 TaxID=3154232 RepID=UPI0033E724F9